VDDAGFYFDIVTAAPPLEKPPKGAQKVKYSPPQVSQIVFTLYWPQAGQWEGSNYTIEVLPATQK